jgi:hypothetical protein
MASSLQTDQIALTVHPADGGSEVSVAFITQGLNALQEMVYLAALQAEGRTLHERLRLPDELRNRYVLQCAPPQVGSFAILGRVVDRSGMADLLTPQQIARVVALVLGSSAAIAAGHTEELARQLPDSRLRNRMLICATKLSPPVGSGHRCEVSGADVSPISFDENLPSKMEPMLRPAEAQREIQTVTGRLQAIDFVKHVLRMQHAPSRRVLECFYEEDVESMLLDNRRDLIQVTGQVVLDDQGQPKEIVAVDQIWDLDLSPLALSEVNVRGVQLRARQPLELTPVLSEDEQLVCLGHEPWSLDVFAPTRTELLVEAKEQLIVLWHEYAQAADEVLSEPAQRVKRKLLEDWVEVGRAQG